MDAAPTIGVPSSHTSSTLRRGAGGWTRGRPLAAAFSCLIIVAVAAPVVENWRDQPVDSFPLSYYPMFSYTRDPTSKVTYLAGVDAHGNRRPLHYRHFASGGMNQVRKQIRTLVTRGEADRVCATAAANVARSRDPLLADIATVEVRSETYDLRGYFTGTDPKPLSATVHSRCPVKRD